MGTCITSCNARWLLRCREEPNVVSQLLQDDGWNVGIDPQDPSHVIVYGPMDKAQRKLYQRKAGECTSETTSEA